jgi:hypothetical protein
MARIDLLRDEDDLRHSMGDSGDAPRSGRL